MATALWTPEKIETALWLDAADSSTITESGGAVSVWADKSGNGYHATQPTSGNQPTIASSVISFNGSSQWMTCGDVLDLDDQPLQCAIVGNQSAQDKFSPFAKSVAYDYSNRYWMSSYSGSLSVNLDYGPSAEASMGFTSIDTHIFGGAWFPSDSLRLYLDGELMQSVSVSAYNSTSTYRFLIGGYPDRYDNNIISYHQGALFELVFWRSIGQTDRQKIEGYLAHKWGLAANLPADHPYKLLAPSYSYFAINGIVTDRFNNPCSRTVYCIDRDLGDTRPTVIDYTTSNSITGEYELVVPTPGEYCVVALSEENDNLNDLITRVTVDE